MINFNKAALLYLMYSFESTGWSRQFIGEIEDGAIVVNGITPKGPEAYLWRFMEDGTLERLYASPMNQEDGKWKQPDEKIIFKKVK